MRDGVSRAAWLVACLTGGMLLLTGQLYRLTVSQSAEMRLAAEHNMIRELSSYGPRGVIYDRNGRPLATSEPAFSAVLINQDPTHVDLILPQLSLVLGGGDEAKAKDIAERVRRQVADNVGRQFEPLTIERKLDPVVVATFLERAGEFVGVVMVTESTRNYPSGPVAGSIVGYVGQIRDELKDPAFAEYGVNEVVGKAGLEQSYEHQLHGTPGRNEVVVDPLGHPVKDQGGTPPLSGNNLFLSLDFRLQLASEEILSKQMAWMRQQKNPYIHANPTLGAIVVQDVRTGAILAMATLPTYDPNVMVSGLSTSQWDALQSRSDFSMVNWALTGFAPGSTYKMATGLAGMSTGVVGPYEKIPCPATYWRFGNPRNWNGYDQGPTDMVRALATSCNPYFFELGYRMGIDRMSEFVSQFGFGERIGIDLPEEDPGINPTQAEYGDRWQPGNVISVAIGQGDVLVSPLQLVNYTATIANSGKRHQPYLVEEIRSPSGETVFKRKPEPVGQVKASAESWRRIHEGMRDTVVSSEGTAYWAFHGFPIPTAAKTGSAETNRGTDAVTVVYAPFDKPEVAVSVFIQGGGSGSWTAPIARRVLAAYFGINDTNLKGVPTYDDAARVAGSH